jgi:hypothetical protein
MKRKDLEQGAAFSVRVGEFVENSIERSIVKGREAPVLTGEPEENRWYRVHIPEGVTGDGSEYHIYISKSKSENLCVFLSGGGVAWNEYTAARPVTGGRVAAGLPNYYWNSLRPFTQIMNIQTGITETDNPRNPFASWNFLIITYATGDFHVGRRDFPYEAVDGSHQILHFHGYGNFRAGMDAGRKYFRTPRKLLIAGDSAGAFAVPALAGEILEDYFPECQDVTLLSDSGQLLYDRWKMTARDVWNAEEKIWRAINGPNITLDWYRSLYKKWGDRLNYLYASSVRDYLLSAYYNDVENNTYKTDGEVQEIFFRQLREMVRNLKKLTPRFGIFLNDWKNFFLMRGGTVHTAVRKRHFYHRTRSGVTMADWLSNAVDGRIQDVGLELLKRKDRI